MSPVERFVGTASGLAPMVALALLQRLLRARTAEEIASWLVRLP